MEETGRIHQPQIVWEDEIKEENSLVTRYKATLKPSLTEMDLSYFTCEKPKHIHR